MSNRNRPTMTPRRHRTGSERGSATVLGVSIIAVSVLLVVVLAGLGGAQAARHRAQQAADLAALAAARSLTGGAVPACAAAAATAAAAGARLVDCQVTWPMVDVAVSAPAPGGGEAHAAARAGPVITNLSRAPPEGPTPAG